MSWQFPPAVVRELRGLTIDRLFLVLSLTHIKGFSIVGCSHTTQTLEFSSDGVTRPDRLAVGRELHIFRLRTITT